MSQQVRPTITNGKLGVGNFGVAVMPDGTTNSLRILITPDGFHFKATDFDDLVLPNLSFNSPKGTKYSLSFDDDGALLINGVKYTAPTNQGNETIKGNKTYEGKTKLSGGLQLTSPNGTVFNIVVDDDGKLTTEKEVSNA
ncbi:hypothetical protein Q8A50_05605 [Leuconostoc mesenteroides]|uniref:hypothetical protein n=1 Tax=Leuconostoc mesenteroides TaxID=1245 RepID=UPI0027308FDA|nr:hypothetical protein [Leuconostoc mesenteroides]MDP0487038.1 hypothetical protein [Leuconostoc mesenteroides]WMS38990.1 hypothetical protein Q8F54_06130 [Leuconostoc mesenteroides]